MTGSRCGFASLRCAISAVLLLLLLAGDGSGQAPERLAVYNVSFGSGTIASLYDQPAAWGANQVVYPTETVYGKATLKNQSEETIRIAFGAPSFELVWQRVEGGTGSGAGPVKFAPAWQIESAGTSQLVTPTDEITLSPGARLVIGFEVDTARLQPGVYQLRVSPQGWTIPIRMVRDTSVLAFEVRQPISLASKVDFHSRRVRRALWAEDITNARALVNELRAMCPTCGIAHQLDGDVAIREGRKQAADRAHERADELVKSGADGLLRNRESTGR
jgi:hypothetical protein